MIELELLDLLVVVVVVVAAAAVAVEFIVEGIMSSGVGPGNVVDSNI